MEPPGEGEVDQMSGQQDNRTLRTASVRTRPIDYFGVDLRLLREAGCEERP